MSPVVLMLACRNNLPKDKMTEMRNHVIDLERTRLDFTTGQSFGEAQLGAQTQAVKHGSAVCWRAPNDQIALSLVMRAAAIALMLETSSDVAVPM
jgi:hypothetical protein